METIAVNVTRRQPTADIHADIEQAKWLANLMDAQFNVAGVRFGLDAVMGVLPVLGDTIALVVGMYPIHLARKHKLGRRVEWRMWANLAIDYFGGLVPLVGDLFDVTYKANLKNVELLEKAARRPHVG